MFRYEQPKSAPLTCPHVQEASATEEMALPRYDGNCLYNSGGFPITSLSRKAQKKRLRVNVSRQARQMRKLGGPQVFAHCGILIHHLKMQEHMNESIKSNFNLSYNSVSSFSFLFLFGTFSLLYYTRQINVHLRNPDYRITEEKIGIFSLPSPQMFPETILVKRSAHWNCVCVINCT